MTGFARSDGTFQSGELKYAFSWEVKSVNAKGLDIKVKLPIGFDEMEGEVKNFVSQNFTRGTFNLFLNIQNEIKNTEITIDETLLEKIKDKVLKVYTENENIFLKPSVTDLLKVDGVLKINETTIDDETKSLLYKALLETLKEALKRLQMARAAEGKKIGLALLQLLDEIEKKRENGEEIAKGMQTQIKDKISEQIKTFVAETAVSPERLEQEVLFYVMRADVKEELERLKAHILNAREIFKQGGNIGRKLDFLCQELNREANTLCSKSMDLTLTQIGMDLKALIEQFREQVQNME